MPRFVPGDWVRVVDSYEIVELRGRSGQIGVVPAGVANSLGCKSRVGHTNSEPAWVVFKPEGSNLDISEIDAGLFSQDDLEPCPPSPGRLRHDG